TILATFGGKSSSSSSSKATTSKPAAKRPPPKPSTSKATTQTRSSNGKQREILEISDDSVTESETESETEPESDEIQIIETAIGWAYMGSHNFTPSAWGTLSGSAFCPVLNIRNYELGIVFPLKTQADVEKVACWERPAEGYAGTEREPWIQQESVYFGGGGMG
ncbi:hypothetical protein V5O48_009915, partial [Marasmius crinis-equi]